MVDFSIITPRVATGGLLSSAADVATLAAAGITDIIDVTDAENDTAWLGQSGLGYLYNPTADDGQPKPVSWFAASLAFALPLIAQPHKMIYAHCSAGCNRGPSTAYAILRAVGWDAADALTLIHTKRPATVGGIRYAPDADAAIVSLGYAPS